VAALTTARDLTALLHAGPFFDGAGSDVPPPLEFHTRFSPIAMVTGIANRIEGYIDNAVTIVVLPGVTLRGCNLQGEPRSVELSITASSFFIINSAATVAGEAGLGTDRTPLLFFSSDRRTVTFSLGTRHSLVLGSLQYTVRLFVTNPTRYFWAITENEPWLVAVEQGPRLGCQGCPSVRLEGSFNGPSVVFIIREFQVFLGSFLLGASTMLVFTFQLIYRAEQLELLLPSGFFALSCEFHSPHNLDHWIRRFLVCVPTKNVARVTNQPPGRPLEPLPAGQTLGFRSSVQLPAADSGDIVWSARALDTNGVAVAHTQEEDDVHLRLYAREFLSVSVVADDHHANVTTVVTVQLESGIGYQPGDTLRITAPVGFHWSFTASEFSRHPAGLGLQEALPVKVTSADGTTNVLVLRIMGITAASKQYGFRARIVHPCVEPVHNRWSLEAFGPAAGTSESQRYESASWEVYWLSLVVDTSISPWSQVRSDTGPVTIAFRTRQAVAVGGALIVRSPPDFAFTSFCALSVLRLDRDTRNVGTVIPPAAVRCSVVTPNEVRLIFVGGDPNGFRGLVAHVKHVITVHSVKHTVAADSGLLPHDWYLETVDSLQMTLDISRPVDGFYVAEQLPYAELFLGGPFMGADPRAAEQQWATIAFQVLEPTRPGQTLSVFAAPGFVFATFCEIRDPPEDEADLWKLIGSQVSHCEGLGPEARLRIQTAWQPRQIHAFQVQVTNALPNAEEALALEALFLEGWRLCVDECRQMSTQLSSAIVNGPQKLGLFTTSNVLGERAVLVVRFMLSTSMPPRGLLRIRAPHGFVFPYFCNAFSSALSMRYFALPWRTECEGGGFGAGLNDRRLPSVVGAELRQLAQLQPSEVQLALGPSEADRLLAYKPYIFTLGVRNPGRDSSPMSLTWEVRTTTSSGSLLDLARTHHDRPATGELLSPMLGLPLWQASLYAGVKHSVLVSFRTLREEEGGNEDAILHASRFELYAPVDDDRISIGQDDRSAIVVSSEWDLSNPPACTTPFTTRDGRQVVGLQHQGVTTDRGILICLVDEAGRSLSLTFEPSIVSADRFVELQFAVRNPERAPQPLWNRWRVRLFRVLSSVDDIPVIELVSARKSGIFVALCEANFEGFAVTRTFESVRLCSSEYAVNETALVTFELMPRMDAPLGAVIAVTPAAGFSPVRGTAGTTALANNPHTPGLLLAPETTTGQSASSCEVALILGLPHTAANGPIYFSLAIVNPPVPNDAPLWDFQLRDDRPDAAAAGVVLTTVLERTFGFIGYSVYYRIEVLGLFGSLREVASKYNFVRITFQLPAPLERSGCLRVKAPPGYTLLADGFDRDNLPPFSGPLPPEPGAVLDPSTLNVSIPYGLLAEEYYAFRFGVVNPPIQLRGDQRQPWELWCYDVSGGVIAANRNVPPFELEARFRSVEVLPSSVIPMQTLNVVEVRLALDSSPLEVIRTAVQHDRAFIAFELPPGFRVASWSPFGVGSTAGGMAACKLSVRMLGLVGSLTVQDVKLASLPPASLCHVTSEGRIAVEVEESLQLGLLYHFALEVENPLETPQGNSWRVSTERNGGLLHLAVDVNNFDVVSFRAAHIVATDVRQAFVQLLQIEIRPPQHIRGSTPIQLVAPEEFMLYCSYEGNVPPLGVMPTDTECQMRGTALHMLLPRPIPYAPFLPLLLAGEKYYFVVYCANPAVEAQMTAIRYFEIRIVEAWPVPERILGLRADIRVPALAIPLESLMISVGSVGSAGKPTTISVRFRAPAEGSRRANVQAISLVGPAGVRLSSGISSPCDGFQSTFQESGDTVLPQSVCSGISETAVVIQLPEPLILATSRAGSLTYVFQLRVQSPEVEVLVDLFLLALLPGPSAVPIFAGSAVGFSGRVSGMKPAQLPQTPPEYVVPVPTDLNAPPLSTVELEASGSICPSHGSAGLVVVGIAVVASIPR